MDIIRSDKNFLIEKHPQFGEVKFYSPDSFPFSVYGVKYKNGKYRRMPEKTAKSVSPGVYALHANTAGGRIRFRTDSSFVAIKVRYGETGKMPHFAISGSAGFDLYETGENGGYIGSYIPPFDIRKSYEGIIRFDGIKNRELLINFPTYSEVREISIGLSPEASVLPAEPYSINTPFVFYGSSITQGGCVSKPGSTYEALLSAEFNADYINLGFSGNAKAEEVITQYIASLDMSIFFYDYDHNAPDCDHLSSTHEKMFKAIRKAHPQLPVIFMSRPKFSLNEDDIKRRDIIFNTYKNAVNCDDKNVYFIDGPELMKYVKTLGTVDNTHPTDSGFYSMYLALKPLVEKIIEKGL